MTKSTRTPPGSLLYAATKGAIDQFTRVLAPYLGARRITVNTVSPGATETPLFLRTWTPEFTARIAESYPAKRTGQPEDIASIVAFLARDEASWVNGQNIYVNNVRSYSYSPEAESLTRFGVGSGCMRSRDIRAQV